MAAHKAMSKCRLEFFVDRGYSNSAELKACEDAAIAALVLKPMASNDKVEGRFNESNFLYIARGDKYPCPAGQRAIHRSFREEADIQIHIDWSKPALLFNKVKVQRRLDRTPNATTVRKRTVKHKWGWAHFLTRRIEDVAVQMMPPLKITCHPNVYKHFLGTRVDNFRAC